MAKSNKNLHLTLSERQIIQKGIENGSTKVAIAATLGKDKSTIGKEIKAHRKLANVFSFNRYWCSCRMLNPFTLKKNK